ncbi:MAG: DUF4252 domain-containing protein [Calditrichaeota bacterium]|nr:DUF4252 domain-containing protein [Calditrichota bacterium]
MKCKNVLLFLAVLWISTAWAQENYEKMPGYVDLKGIEEFKNADETVEVFITKRLLKLVASFSTGQDSSLANLIKNLALIRVEKFNIPAKKIEKVKKLIEKTSKKLKSQNWESTLKARKKDKVTEIFLKEEKGKVAGLLIMSVDNSGKAVFVNIVGNIDLDQLGKLSQKFNIPKLDSLSGKK